MNNNEVNRVTISWALPPTACIQYTASSSAAMSTTTMCEFCGELTADKNRHKLVDWRGRSTVIGAVLESFLKL